MTSLLSLLCSCLRLLMPTSVDVYLLLSTILFVYFLLLVCYLWKESHGVERANLRTRYVELYQCYSVFRGGVLAPPGRSDAVTARPRPVDSCPKCAGNTINKTLELGVIVTSETRQWARSAVFTSIQLVGRWRVILSGEYDCSSAW